MVTDNSAINSASDPADVQVQAAAPAPNTTAPPAGLDALSQPGPAAPAMTPAPAAALVPDDAATMRGQMAPFAAKQQAELQAAADAEKFPMAAPSVPHARLMNLISALSTGLGAAARSIGSGGREGGAAEVVRIQGEEQQQRINAQNAALAQKNATVQGHIQAANLAQLQMQNIMNLHTFPNDATKSDLEVKGIAQAQAITGAEFQASHGGMQPAEFSAAISSTAPVSEQRGAAGSFFTVGAQQTLQAAKTSGLPDTDPFVQKLQAVVADPKATAKDLWLATDQLRTQRGLQKEATTEETARHAADPLYKLENDPSEMTGDKAPAAVAMLSEKLKDPTLAADQKPRVQRLLNMATQAQTNALEFDKAKERAKQAVADGDPIAGGALLQSGLVAPSQIVSSRKPEVAQKMFDEAIRLGGGVKNADGKWTGGTWSAVKAESQYKYAENPKTQNTLNLLTTMQNPGGSIDIAQKMFNAIPGKIDSKTFNKIVTGAQTEFGGVSTVNFNAAMTSLADEFAQVLQGGAATETTLKQAHDLIQQAYTKNQGAGAFDTIRLDMAARQKGMVRDNPALMSMYPTAAPTGATGKAYPKGQTSGPQYWHDAQGHNLGLVQ